MSQDQKNYQALLETSRYAHNLVGISRVLEWDKETYMPAGASAIRAEQLELLSGLIHKARTGKEFSSALSKLIDIETGDILASGLKPAQKAALQEWRRDYLKESKLPEKFVKELTNLTAKATHEWAAAKKKNDFKAFAPSLERIIEMMRKKAEYIGYKAHPYDALLDDYEPDATTKEVSALFSVVKPAIVELLKKITHAKQVEDRFLSRTVSHDKQMELVAAITQAIGYNLEHGRIDISSHPFSTSFHPSDSRITTRVKPNALMDNIGACLHEFGHSLYEMNLPAEHFGSPLCESISLGIHESQSRWWETRIGQSQAFWKHCLPILQQHLKGAWADISLDAFYKAINKVTPSFIRVESDEVTYTLHVILRFELEQALIEGKLKPKEIPEAWNAKMQESLGICPKTDTEGCLQDIHWSMGGFGYFPTYALGNLYASHFFSAFEQKHPKWESHVAKGEFTFIRDWLKEQIHQHGRRYTTKELCKHVTGKPLSPEAYLHYLRGKYAKIYGFKQP